MQARTVGAVEGHRVAGTGSWVAYVPVEEEEEAEEAEEPAEPAEEEEEEGDEADEGERKDKEEGSDLVLLSLNTGEETRYDMVTDYFFAEDAEVLAFATSTSDGSGDGAYVVDLDDMTRHAVLEGEGNYKQLAVADDGSQVALLSDRDDYEDTHVKDAKAGAGGRPGRCLRRGHPQFKLLVNHRRALLP